MEFNDQAKEAITILSEKVLEQVYELKSQEDERRLQNEKTWNEFVEARGLIGEDLTIKKKLLFVVATPNTDEEYRSSEECKALDKIVYDNTFSDSDGIFSKVEVSVVSENKKGLSAIYNQYMNKKYKGYYVCFIHDDVTVSDSSVYEKLLLAHDKYAVVGLAGATKIQLPFRMDTPTAWHMLSQQVIGKNAYKHQSGFVAHHDVTTNQKFSTNFGKVPQEVKLIDGLFMSFDVEKCLDSGFTFDEDFQFHHYDLSASIRALECGLKITTWDIFVMHKGMGVMDATWHESHRKFVTKYLKFNG